LPSFFPIACELFHTWSNSQGDISFASNDARSVPKSLITVTEINKNSAFFALTKQIVTI